VTDSSSNTDPTTAQQLLLIIKEKSLKSGEKVALNFKFLLQINLTWYIFSLNLVYLL